MCDYEFELPFPPSVNSWVRVFRNRIILTKKGRDYRKLVGEHLEKLNLTNEKVKGNLIVSMVLNPPTMHRYDVDNYSKSLFDALEKHGFWENDEQVVKLTIEKGEKIKGGNVIFKCTVK